MTIIRKLVTLSNRLTRSFKEQLNKDFTAAGFEDKHLRNLVSLKDRETLLKHLPEGGTVAEIGVNEGDFSSLILEITKPQKLVLIDVWGTKRYHGGLFEKVKHRFGDQLNSGQVEIMRDLSFDAIVKCPDQYFDWVYVDTDHSYPTTKRELELLRTKMKSGGIIAGHDYIIGNWNAGVRYGVMEAVREFCLQHDWEMIFMTHELGTTPSFAIRQII